MEEELLEQPGALIDERADSEKIRDFKFEEIVASATSPSWKEKAYNTLRRFPDQHQDGSGSCVAQTLKKLLGIYVFIKTNVFVKLSASHIYQRRSNKPSGGMNSVDAFKIAQTGVTLEEFVPSEELNDTEMDAYTPVEFMRKIGEVFKIGSYLTVTPGNIDTVASIIEQTGKGVMVWFYFTSAEWKANKEGDYTVPEVKTDLTGPGDARSLRHSVAAVDYFLFKGKKALLIEDSSPFGGVSRRIVTEDYFIKRNWFVGHFMNFAFEEESAPLIPKPTHTFNTDLEFSPTVQYSDDVKALQEILKYESLFPSNIESSGYYGSITKIAVGKFQLKHGVVTADTDAGYGRVGPKTRATLNALYSH